MTVALHGDKQESRAVVFARQINLALVVLLVLYGVVGVLQPSYLEPAGAMNFLRRAAPLAILASGQDLVLDSGGFDLSVGSLVALTGVVAALVANSLHLSGFPLIAVTLLAALAVGAGAGWINALPVVRLNLPPFITTLAMLEMALGLSFFSFNKMGSLCDAIT